jgi:hypothetical protein
MKESKTSDMTENGTGNDEDLDSDIKTEAVDEEENPGEPGLLDTPKLRLYLKFRENFLQKFLLRKLEPPWFQTEGHCL